MNRIDDLISKHCPNGVPFKPVGELADYVRGLTYSKADEASDGPIKVLRANNITLSSNRLNFDDVKTVSAAVRRRQDQRLRRNDILISAASGSKAHVGKVAFIDADLDYYFGGFMAAIRATGPVTPRFLFHLLIGRAFSDFLAETLDSTTINNLSASVMRRFNVPVPPLEVQRQIVQVLDRFTELEVQLEAELGAELKKRRLQYVHFRSQMLAEASNAPVRALGEIAVIGTGRHDTKDAVPGGEYVFYARGREPLRLDTYDFDETAIITAGDGAGVGKVFHFAEGKYALHQRAYRIVPHSELDARYLHHHFVDNFESYLETISVRGSVTSLRRPMFENYRVPLPSMAEQQRISAALDRFDALANDLNVSLPAELDARRKQYEYYRDKLLTFEEVPA